MALRYFKEQHPKLHVIGAGSLLEFTLNDEDFRMPVGRVQFVYLKPMSFKEFLKALGYSNLIHYIENFILQDDFEEPIHQKLLQLVHEYMVFGGMPIVVQSLVDQEDLAFTQQLQTILGNMQKGSIINIYNVYMREFPI